MAATSAIPEYGQDAHVLAVFVVADYLTGEAGSWW
jgi:hypothetical protein